MYCRYCDSYFTSLEEHENHLLDENSCALLYYIPNVITSINNHSRDLIRGGARIGLNERQSSLNRRNVARYLDIESLDDFVMYYDVNEHNMDRVLDNNINFGYATILLNKTITDPDEAVPNYDLVFSYARIIFINMLERMLNVDNDSNVCTFSICTETVYKKTIVNDFEQEEKVIGDMQYYCRSQNNPVSSLNYIEKYDDIIAQLRAYLLRNSIHIGSGWVLFYINKLEMKVASTQGTNVQKTIRIPRDLSSVKSKIVGVLPKNPYVITEAEDDNNNEMSDQELEFNFENEEQEQEQIDFVNFGVVEKEVEEIRQENLSIANKFGGNVCMFKVAYQLKMFLKDGPSCLKNRIEETKIYTFIDNECQTLHKKFYIKNEGIPYEKVEEFLRCCKDLFDPEDKLTINIWDQIGAEEKIHTSNTKKLTAGLLGCLGSRNNLSKSTKHLNVFLCKTPFKNNLYHAYLYINNDFEYSNDGLYNNSLIINTPFDSKKYYCPMCFIDFDSVKSIKKHIKNFGCKTNTENIYDINKKEIIQDEESDGRNFVSELKESKKTLIFNSPVAYHFADSNLTKNYSFEIPYIVVFDVETINKTHLIENKDISQLLYNYNIAFCNQGLPSSLPQHADLKDQSYNTIIDFNMFRSVDHLKNKEWYAPLLQGLLARYIEASDWTYYEQLYEEHLKNTESDETKNLMLCQLLFHDLRTLANALLNYMTDCKIYHSSIRAPTSELQKFSFQKHCFICKKEFLDSSGGYSLAAMTNLVKEQFIINRYYDELLNCLTEDPYTSVQLFSLNQQMTYDNGLERLADLLHQWICTSKINEVVCEISKFYKRFFVERRDEENPPVESFKYVLENVSTEFQSLIRLLYNIIAGEQFVFAKIYDLLTIFAAVANAEYKHYELFLDHFENNFWSAICLLSNLLNHFTLEGMVSKIFYNCFSFSLVNLQLDATKKKLLDVFHKFEREMIPNFLITYFGEGKRVVTHHDHYTGRIYGKAHSHCNLKLTQNEIKVIIYSHNSCFDNLFVLHGLPFDHNVRSKTLMMKRGKKFAANQSTKDVSLIGVNQNRIRLMTIQNMDFRDSLSLTGSSLEKLSSLFSEQDMLFLKEQIRNTVIEYYCDDKNISQEEKEQILQLTGQGKITYPYDFADSYAKMNQKLEESILSNSDIYRTILNKNCQQEFKCDPIAINNTCKLFQILKCQNLGDLCAFYVKSDCWLTITALRMFSNSIREEYGLELKRMASLTRLSQTAVLLKGTKMPILVSPTVEMFDMFNNGMRAGMSFSALRFSRSGLIEKDCYGYVQTIDENSCYTNAQTKNLPTSGFVIRKDITCYEQLKKIYNKLFNDVPDFRRKPTGENHDFPQFDLHHIKVGFMIECDLEVPKEMHDQYMDMSPLIIKAKPDVTRMSPFQLTYLRKAKKSGKGFLKLNINVKKLLGVLFSVQNYVCSHHLLIYLVEFCRFKCSTIHKVLEYTTAPIFRDYMEKNVIERNLSDSAVKRELLKLQNNTLYGATLKKEECYKQIECVLNESYLSKYEKKHHEAEEEPPQKKKRKSPQRESSVMGLLVKANKYCVLPELEGLSKEEGEFAAGSRVFLGTCSKEKKVVKITSVRGVGVNILDLSKISLSLMEQRVRQTVKDMFGEQASMQVCYSDTDSISFCVYYKSSEGDMGEEIEKKLVKDHSSYFDTSNYPKNHELFNPSVRKLLDRFQFENAYSSEHRIVELVSSAVKEYNKHTLNKENIQKHKGISSKVVYTHDEYVKRVANMRTLKFELFDDSYKNNNKDKEGEKKIDLYRMIQSKNEKLIQRYEKTMFSTLSDKRYVFMDGITTCAYGHWRLQPIKDYFEKHISLHNGNESSILEDSCLRKAAKMEEEIVQKWPEMKQRIGFNKTVAEKFLD